MKRITIQGQPGCFHETAARCSFPGEQVEILPCDSFDQQFARMAADPTLLGILFDHLEDVAAKRYRTIMRAYGLTMEVLRHIKDHADISQDVKDRINLVDLMAK